jgi:hypothetical protein
MDARPLRPGEAYDRARTVTSTGRQRGRKVVGVSHQNISVCSSRTGTGSPIRSTGVCHLVQRHLDQIAVQRAAAKVSERISRGPCLMLT